MKKVIVDTSIWIEYFKGNEISANIIHDKTSFEIYVTGPIVTELIQGMKTDHEKDLFTTLMKGLPSITITDQNWVEAGLIGSALRKKGITIPLTDIIIYTIALNQSCAIITLDNHLNRINKTTGSKLEIISL